jgi:hypothetical protein
MGLHYFVPINIQHSSYVTFVNSKAFEIAREQQVFQMTSEFTDRIIL